MVAIEYAGTVYELSEATATLLAENLRNLAAGTFPRDSELVTQLSGNPNWADGALPVANCIEDVLVGARDQPVPLEGKAAEATRWALQLMVGLGGSTDPTDAAALREALRA